LAISLTVQGMKSFQLQRAPPLTRLSAPGLSQTHVIDLHKCLHLKSHTDTDTEYYCTLAAEKPNS